MLLMSNNRSVCCSAVMTGVPLCIEFTVQFRFPQKLFIMILRVACYSCYSSEAVVMLLPSFSEFSFIKVPCICIYIGNPVEREG